jgi:hypothetical protein
VPPAETPDVDAMIAELEVLLDDERRLSALRRRLHDQIDMGFTNQAIVEAERRVSDARREIHRRIDELRAALARSPWDPAAPLEDRRRRLHALGQ